MEIFTNTNYNFLKWRFHAIAFSVVFVLIGAAMYVKNGGVNQGIDFAGGAQVILKFKEPVPVDKLRSLIADATIQQYGKPEERSVLVRLPQQKQEGDYAGQVVVNLNKVLNPASSNQLDLNFQGRAALAELLKSKDPDKKGSSTSAHEYYYDLAQRVIERRSELGIFTDMPQVASTPGLSKDAMSVLSQNAFLGAFNVLSQETVGPQVGRELQTKAFWAIILSTLAMGVYIAIRFDLKFGVAAILCLVHDVMIGLAFMGLINGEYEIITVAAFLMIIGYSINDTVVVYDRVRENVKKSRVREDFETLMNRTLNQTLSRTILTGGCVVLILIALILFGGEVINQFAWLLLIGTLAGTYSTLFVVPAIVLAWNNRVAKSSGRPRAEVVRREASVEAATPRGAKG